MCVICEWQRMTGSAVRIWQSNKEEIYRWRNTERMSGRLQTMAPLWRAFGRRSNPVNAGLGPTHSTSQIYAIHWLLWRGSTSPPHVCSSAETTRGVFLGTKANVWLTQSAPQSIFTHNQAAISPSPSHAAAETGKNPDELKIHTEKNLPLKPTCSCSVIGPG